MEDIKHSFFSFEKIDETEAYNANPQSLAFVGDSVYTLYIRTNFCSVTTAKSGMLHKQATAYIKATAQKLALEKIIPHLTEKELALIKRARNTKINSAAKHATLEEYKASTAYEALLGYLYLTKQKDRLEQILNLAHKKEEN